VQLRAWLVLTVVIATVQAVLALLATLQHDALFSSLVRQRLAVSAQATAQAFQPIVELGLPLAMMRNGDAIASRPIEIDPTIEAVDVFAPTGTVLYSSRADPPQAVPGELLVAMRLADAPAWTIETTEELDSGYSVLATDGRPVGAVVVRYPKDGLQAASAAMRWRTATQALAVTAAFASVAWLLLWVVLAGPRRALRRLESWAAGHPPSQAMPGNGPFATAMHDLETRLAGAGARFAAARACVAATTGNGRSATVPDSSSEAASAGRTTGSLAAETARRVALPAALLIVLSAILLGALALATVTRSIESELAARPDLIGAVVSETVGRAVRSGVPIESLVGVESYFREMLERLPEVNQMAIVSDRVLFAIGPAAEAVPAMSEGLAGAQRRPVFHDGQEVGKVLIAFDPAFVTRRFRDAFLDMGVIVLVTIFLAFEIMVLLTSRSLTAGFDQLQRLAAMQAAGDFSKQVVLGTRNALGRLATQLSERAIELGVTLAEAERRTGRAAVRRADLAQLRARLGLARGAPEPLRLSYFTDVRLALFLFAAADQLPLSFLPLFTRAASNPWPWMDSAVVISLPLAGYLLAILLAAPFSRAWTERLGHRRLLLVAAMPTAVSHLGLYYATSVPEIVLWRTVTGFGYALVSLACQDYVIDNVSRDQRDRSLGMFQTVLFGGIFCGTALGGVLADRLGQANVFLLSVLLIGLSCLLVHRLLRPSVPLAPRASVVAALPPLRPILNSRRFASLVFGIAIPAGIVLQAFIAYLVALTLDASGASVADIGRTLMLYFLAVALVGPLAGRIIEAGGTPTQLALAGAAVSAAALLLAGSLPGQLPVMAAVLGAGIGHGMVRGAQVSLAIDIAETDLARIGPTAALSALRTLERAGSILGLVLVAGLSGMMGYPAAISVLAGIVIAGALVFAMGIRPRMARPPAE
jgi:MFS family permease